MKIYKQGSKFIAVFDTPSGLGKSDFEYGANTFAPGTYNIDFESEPGVIKPKLALSEDTGVTEKVRAAIKTLDSGADRLVYFGVSSGGLISAGKIDLGSPTTNTQMSTIASTAGISKGTNMVEWLSKIWAVGDNAGGASATKTLLINAATADGSSAASVASMSASNQGVDLLVAKSFLYYCNNSAVGRASDASTFNATALQLQSPLTTRSLTTFGDFIIVGATPFGDQGFGQLIKWDGVSTIIDGQPILVPDSGMRVIRNFNGAVYIFCIGGANNYGFKNVLRIYAWQGGDNVQLMWELQLNNTATTSIEIYPGGVQASGGKLWFTVSAPTANTMKIDNGVFSIDSNNTLSLEYVGTADTNDTTDIDAFFLRWIENALYTIHINGSTTRFSRMSGLSYSANAPLVLPAFRPDPLRKSVISRIRFGLKPLPASTSVVGSVKVDQESSFNTVKTWDTDNITEAKVENTEYKFQPGNVHQPKFLLAGSGSAKPEILLPIVIEGEIQDDQQ